MVRSVVPRAALGSAAVAALLEGGGQGELRQYAPAEDGASYDPDCKGSGCAELMAVLELDLFDCFKGASPVSSGAARPSPACPPPPTRVLWATHALISQPIAASPCTQRPGGWLPPPITAAIT